jgi:hypothetical protein
MRASWSWGVGSLIQKEMHEQRGLNGSSYWSTIFGFVFQVSQNLQNKKPEMSKRLTTSSNPRK